MNLSEIKDLMTQFDQSSLRELSLKQDGYELRFSKNDHPEVPTGRSQAPVQEAVVQGTAETVAVSDVETVKPAEVIVSEEVTPEGEAVESPLVGVAYLAAAPDKSPFVSVGDVVKKGQTLLIIEAMKVMNEVPAPRDGVVTEILVSNEDVIEYGQGLVRLK